MTEREPTGQASMGEPPGALSQPASEATVNAKCAFFESLDARLAATGPAMSPGAPAPPVPPPAAPAPALSLEAWMELSACFAHASLADLVAALLARGLSLETWVQLDREYTRLLSDDVRAGKQERAALYQARYEEEQARRAGAPITMGPGADANPGAPGAATAIWAPPMPVALAQLGQLPPTAPRPVLAPEALRSTADSPNLPSMMMAAIGKMPFVSPPPETETQTAPEAGPATGPQAGPVAPTPGKRSARTVQSKVVPADAGLTMPLDPGAMQAPTTPFVASTERAGAVPVPALIGPQYVSLRLELMLQPVPREETLRRYRVPTEAAYRALEQEWRRPGRRSELRIALATLGTALQKMLLDEEG